MWIVRTARWEIQCAALLLLPCVCVCVCVCVPEHVR